MVDAKQQTYFGLCENLADQLIAIYSKTNVQFVPGQNMMPRKSIINKILIDWKIAMEVASHKKFKKKENLLKRMDKLYPVLYCICTEILSCQEKGCSSDCKKQAHIACSCLKEEKIPVIELLFIRDQRARNKAGLSIGLFDAVESQKMQEKFDRKDLDEGIQVKLKNKMEEEKELQRKVSEEEKQESLDIDENQNIVEDDPDFSVKVKKISTQNRVQLDNLARESIRGGVSVRTTASLVTTVLVDLKIVTKEDAHLIIDPSKVQRARERVMEQERIDGENATIGSKLECFFFDGRKDKTKMIVEDEDGDEFARVLNEEHYTLTDPHKYLTHVTPEEGSGAKGVADEILEFLTEVNQLDNVKVIGGDSTNCNTGWRDGAIHHLEVGLDGKVLWDICHLHTNELGLRHVMKSEGMETSGANTFTGELGKLVTEDVHLFEVNEKFEVLDFGPDLRSTRRNCERSQHRSEVHVQDCQDDHHL